MIQSTTTTEDLQAICRNYPRTQIAREAAAELRSRVGKNDWSQYVERVHAAVEGTERLYHVLCYLERQEYEQEWGKVEMEERWYHSAVQLVRHTLWTEQRRHATEKEAWRTSKMLEVR